MSVMTSPCAQRYNDLLPQTQCTECGYAGCLPYATALSTGAETNPALCLPGGQEVADRLAQETGLPRTIVERTPVEYTAHVELSSCIGCNLCMKICPVDAFIGVLNYEHQVIEEDCTGCQLCLPVCPTQCITLQPRTYALPDSNHNRANILRKSQTQEAIKAHKMKNHARSLQKILAAKGAK